MLPYGTTVGEGERKGPSPTPCQGWPLPEAPLPVAQASHPASLGPLPSPGLQAAGSSAPEPSGPVLGAH